MRAKTTVHVEYEILKAILQSKEIGMVVERVKANMVPINDEVAENRFNQGIASAGQFIRNMVDRRRHRIPAHHPDYQEKQKQ